MHHTYALGVAENFDSEGLHNIISNILHVFLVDTPVISPPEFPQLEPCLPLNVDTLIPSKVCMSVIPHGIRLSKIPEILRRQPCQFSEVPIISSEFLRTPPYF